MNRSTGVWRRYRTRIVLALAAVLLLAILLLPSPSHSSAVLLYTVLKGCPDEHRGAVVRADSFLIIGHRGAAGYEVENTLPSMDTALAHGANAVEIDLSMTADGEIVLWHDWLPDDAVATVRASGSEPDVLAKPLSPESESPHFRPVHMLSLDELRTHYGYSLKDSDRRLDARIPTFDEFLAWSAGKSDLRCVVLDIKLPEEHAALAPGMFRRIEAMLAVAAPSYDVIYLTPSTEILRRVDPILPLGNISYDHMPTAGLVLDPCGQSSVDTAIAFGNSAASMMSPKATTVAPWTSTWRIMECEVAKAKRGGVGRVIVATLNEKEKLECLVRLGVNGIITDYPDRLRDVLR